MARGNIFAYTTMLDYYAINVPQEIYRHLTTREFRLLLLISDLASAHDENKVILAAEDIFKAIGLYDTHLKEVREKLRRLHLITFARVPGGGGAWAYSLVNPHRDGDEIKSLRYIPDGELTADQVRKYYRRRLSLSPATRDNGKELITNCPHCFTGQIHTYLKRATDDNGAEIPSGSWECRGGHCKQVSFKGGEKSYGSIIDFELRHSEGKGIHRNWRQCIFIIERIIQTSDPNYDPDAGYKRRDAVRQAEPSWRPCDDLDEDMDEHDPDAPLVEP